jgi:UDP-sulfoquinovose synthase
MMRILLCGYDGYIGYPLAQHLLRRGHELMGIDALHRRRMVGERGLTSIIPIVDPQQRERALQRMGMFKQGILGDIARNYEVVRRVFQEFQPEGIINLAQQPSASYSMIDPFHARWTIENNVHGLLNILWAMRDFAPTSHVVTLGTMGEYGTPNVPIPEGFFEVEYEGYTDILPFPRQTNSVYHTSKVMASDLSWFAARVWELRITDIQQGVVYGTRTNTMDTPELRTRYDVGECFGTMINRAVACAIMKHPIIPYGSGRQKRAYIALQDSINCLTLAIEHPPTDDDSIHGYRIINQFDDCYNCDAIAANVAKIAKTFDLNAEIHHIENPRIESEVHFYQPHHEKLYNMGWTQTRSLDEELVTMFEDLLPLKDTLTHYQQRIIPTIKWRPIHTAIKQEIP